MVQIKGGVNTDNKFVDKVISNTKSNLIEITDDKLENILLKHIDKLTIVKSWITPMSLFITILIVFLTADFKTFIGVEKQVWKAVFMILLAVSFVWTIYASIKAYSCRKKAKIDFLISEIKNNRE
jgi:uncharacterized membrane protein YqjE